MRQPERGGGQPERGGAAAPEEEGTGLSPALLALIPLLALTPGSCSRTCSSPLLLLSSPLPRTQLPGRWAWGRLLTRLISLTAASRPAQALRSQVQELFNL